MRLDPKRLIEARKSARLTQEELGDRIGKAASQVSHYENGHYKPRPDALAAIARETGRTLEFFFNADDEEAALKEELWSVMRRVADAGSPS